VRPRCSSSRRQRASRTTQVRMSDAGAFVAPERPTVVSTGVPGIARAWARAAGPPVRLVRLTICCSAPGPRPR
jgi:hypothetical protein